MKFKKIYLHFVYKTHSFTLEENINIECFILGIHSFNQKSIWIRYARPDGALTFAEYLNNYKNYGELLSVSIIPKKIYETIRHCKIFDEMITEKILDYLLF